MNQPICQSCGMPMETEELYATNQDGSANSDYCKYCYENGSFTSDDTMEQMIEMCIPHMVQPGSGFTEEQARSLMQSTLPTLKRWKKV